MKINRMADVEKSPSWCFDNFNTKEASSFISNSYVSTSDMKRLASLPTNGKLSDDQLVNERAHIEACAEQHTSYVYNQSWSQESTGSLKEYAAICNCKTLSAKVTPSHNIVTASRSATANSTLSLSDPFKLDEVSSDRLTSPKKEDWETITTEKKLGEKPAMAGSVRSIRGGESTLDNSFTQTARGQNSIGNADAIEKYQSSPEEMGETLKKINQEKIAQKKQNHVDWQKEKIDMMSDKNIVSNRRVFPTEVLNAQPGIVKNPMLGVYADFNPDVLPNKTGGEMISDNNAEMRKSIKREVPQDDWEQPSKQSIREISVDFAESLKKSLKK